MFNVKISSVCLERKWAQAANLRNFHRSFENEMPGGRGVHNNLRVRVYAAHMGGFLGPKFSKQRSLFRQIFHKQGWVIKKLAKDSKTGWFSAKIHHKSGYDGNFR